MTVFVSYLYHRGPFDKTEPEFIPVQSKDLSINVPNDALGFSFVEAENQEEAKLKAGGNANYLLGKAAQVFTVGDMEEILEATENKEESDFLNLTLISIETMNEYLETRGKPLITAYFFISNFSQIAMRNTDVVIDPETRKIVYPKPKPSLK